MAYRVEVPCNSEENIKIRWPTASGLSLLKKTGETGESGDGCIIAVRICSQVLDACIWLAFDPGFKPDDDEPLALFHVDEIPFLKDKSPEQLREIHQIKLIFPGCKPVKRI